MTYNTIVLANGDLVPMQIPDSGPAFQVRFDDPGFQAWYAGQQNPPPLSVGQQAIQQAKQSTFPQFQTWLNNQYGAPQPAGVARLLYELMQRALKNEIV